MKTTGIIFLMLAILAAVLGLWILVGVAAFIARVCIFLFLTAAVLSYRKKLAA